MMTNPNCGQICSRTWHDVLKDGPFLYWPAVKTAEELAREALEDLDRPACLTTRDIQGLVSEIDRLRGELDVARRAIDELKAGVGRLNGRDIAASHIISGLEKDLDALKEESKDSKQAMLEARVERDEAQRNFQDAGLDCERYRERMSKLLTELESVRCSLRGSSANCERLAEECDGLRVDRKHAEQLKEDNDSLRARLVSAENALRRIEMEPAQCQISMLRHIVEALEIEVKQWRDQAKHMQECVITSANRLAAEAKKWAV